MGRIPLGYYYLRVQILADCPPSVDDNCGEWVECMDVVSGCG